MNCKGLARIMPELAAGELKENKAAEAREHLADCASCAREYKNYETVQAALCAPREMAELPAKLDILHLPEKALRPWLRPALASVGAAVILLAAILALPAIIINKPNTSTSLVVTPAPPKPQIIELRDIPPPKPVKRHFVQVPVHRHRRVVEKRYIASKPKPVKTPEPPVIIIVSQAKLPPESYSFEIQSTDTRSGVTSIYSTVHDDAAGTQSSEITSSTTPGRS